MQQLGKRVLMVIVGLVMVICFAGSAWAVPGLINYQGKLLQNGTALTTDDPISMTFKIFIEEFDTGGSPIWVESQDVDVANGIYAVKLGAVNPLDSSLLEAPNIDYWLEVTVAGETLTPRQRLTSVPFALNAATLDGYSAVELDQSAHVADTGNPHQVTAAQVGAATLTDLTWSNLSGIPAGFADGVDNNSGGTITGVTAGTGLNGGGTSGSIALNVDVPLELTGSTGNQGKLGTHDYGVYGSAADTNFYAGYFFGKTVVEGGALELNNSSGQNWLTVLRGSNQNAGFAFKEEGATETQWIFPFFRGWQSDNLIVRDEIANKDVMTFQMNTGRVGVGTSTPEALLDVNGAGRIRGDLVVENGVTFSDGTTQRAAATPSWYQILPAVDRFELVMNNEAVLDHETGLVWQRNTSDTKYDWASAQSHCYISVIGGRKGWRLPTIDELATLIDPTQISPALPSGYPFTNVKLLHYWSSTTRADRTDYAWIVYFYDGSINSSYKSTNYYVRAVRSGQ